MDFITANLRSKITPRKLAQMPVRAHIVQVKRLRIILLSTGALLAASGSAQVAPQSGAQLTVLPFVQPNGVVDLSLSANWFNRTPGFGFSSAGINTQYQQLANGQPMNISGYATQLRTFNHQQIPFLGRAPFVGGLFRNRTHFQSVRTGNFSTRLTLVDPAGRPVRPTYGRRTAPRPYGFVRPPQR
ncbi:MAG: hypothetical protein CL741_06445 [Chloroflexi bacterium]|nr:hypothetical protein [Chloroflexota bacterium]